MSAVSRYAGASLAASELAAWTLTQEFKTLGVEALPGLARMALDYSNEANAAAAYLSVPANLPEPRIHALRRLLRDQIAASLSVERAPQ